MSSHEDLRSATEAFAVRLSGVGDDQWERPTPCSEWTVRQLFAHVAGGNRFAVALLAGATTQDALAAARSLDPTADARSLFQTTAEEQLGAFCEPDALARTCHHSIGDITGAQLIGLRTGDLIVHAWDLATAVGGDQDLGDELVTLALRVYEPMATQLARSGLFGAGATRDPAGLTRQQRLLDIVGRAG
jgi:uncharacterized protein (TIGR03086 family)